MKDTITMKEINAYSTWSKKDDSPRGCKTVCASEIKPGDKVVYLNRFTLVIDDEPETESPEEITEEILEYFQSNEETFNDAIEELDSYNGYLGDDKYYSMEDLDELYAGKPSEALARAFYGHDENYHTHADGTEEYAPFNPNREYFRFNGYGNLVSTDYKDYSDNLDKWTVEEMMNNRSEIWTIDHTPELADLFDRLEAARSND